MPSKPKAQSKYMFQNNPSLAKEFARKTLNISAPPDKVKRPTPPLSTDA